MPQRHGSHTRVSSVSGLQSWFTRRGAPGRVERDFTAPPPNAVRLSVHPRYLWQVLRRSQRLALDGLNRRRLWSQVEVRISVFGFIPGR